MEESCRTRHKVREESWMSVMLCLLEDVDRRGVESKKHSLSLPLLPPFPPHLNISSSSSFFLLSGSLEPNDGKILISWGG